MDESCTTQVNLHTCTCKCFEELISDIEPKASPPVVL